MTTLEHAIAQLHETLEDDRTADNWRWRVRQGLSTVREALGAEQFRSWDGWLSARSRNNDRERIRLMARIGAVGSAALGRLDQEVLGEEVERLVADVEHYRQRVHDLIYDSVALEIGGSE